MRDMGNVPLNAADHLSQSVVNVFADKYEQNIDEMFGRLHEHKEKGENSSSYDKREYKRVAFKHREQVKRFVDKMREQGIDAVAAPAKFNGHSYLNGQYLVEIPAAVVASSITNSELTDGLAPDAILSADKILDHYRAVTFEEIGEPNKPDVYENKTELMQGVQLHTIFTQHLDVLGGLLNKGVSIGHKLDQFGGSSDKDVFKGKNPNVRTGMSKKATVLNNDVVVIDGKVVTGEVRERVLSQHRARMEKADQILSKRPEAGKLPKTFAQTRRAQSNAEQIKSSLYRQEYAVKGADFVKSVSYGGVLDRVVEDLNTNAAAASLVSTISITEDEKDLLKTISESGTVTDREKMLISKALHSEHGGGGSLTGDNVDELTKIVQNYTDQTPLSADCAETAGKYMEKLNTTGNELTMLSSANMAKALEKDFGIRITENNPITREQLLDINAQFIKKAEAAGFQFVKAGGNFDAKLLKSLTKDQLAQIGISEHTRQLLLKINDKSAWGKTGDINAVANAGFKAVTMLIGNDESIQDFQKMYQGAQYAHKGIVAIRRLGNVHISDLAKAKSTGWKSTNDKWSKSRSKAPKAPSQKPSAVNQKRNDSYLKKQEKKLKKASKKENGLTAKFKNAANKAKKAFSESAAGKLLIKFKQFMTKLLLKALIYIGIATLALIIIYLIFFIVLAIISSFTETKYQDTIAYNLYEYLQDEEEAWVKDLKDMDGIYNKRDELKFGSEYKPLKGYLREIDNMSAENGKDIFINPFHGIDGLVSEDNNNDFLTEVKKFDGETSVGISANTNAYNRKSEDEDNNSGYSSIENGHTGNIKDIICMVDVMYQMDVDGSDDGSMGDLIGKTPASVTWNDICHKVGGFFKWIGSHISSWFTGEEPASFRELTGGTVSYSTIVNYSTEVFEGSHQQEIYLNTEFHTNDDGLTDGCDSLTKKDISIFWNSDHVSPFIESGGINYALDDTSLDFDVYVNMDNLKSGETACLWQNMNSDYWTFHDIESQSGHCWNCTVNDEVFEYSQTCVSYWYSAEDNTVETIEAAKNGISEWFNNYIGGMRDSLDMTEEYILATDRNKMTHIWYTSEDSIEWGYDSQTDDYGNVWYRQTATMTYAKKHTTVYERNCQKHTFEYCGGHVGVHSQGIVFSATNEQVAMISSLDENNPLAIGFELAENGYDDIRGKYIKEDINYETVKTASETGGCRSPLFDVQGSFPAQRGLNLLVDGESWGSGMKVRDDTCYHLIRDIFDVDCLIDKGDNIFPLISYTEYEGWTADNMTLMLLRLTMDWYDTYEFDIPWEIGQKTVSSSDINTISDKLKEQYGEAYSENRDKAVRLALAWVGRGHYSDVHTSHDFLAQACEGTSHSIRETEHSATASVQYDGCCTASNSVGFVNYIYAAMEKPTSGQDITGTGAYSIGSCLPADIIVNKEDNENQKAVIYIGTFSEEIELESGQVLEAGVPIVIDLTTVDGIGNIYLHGSSSGDENVKVYDWVASPTSDVSRKSFE